MLFSTSVFLPCENACNGDDVSDEEFGSTGAGGRVRLAFGTVPAQPPVPRQPPRRRPRRPPLAVQRIRAAPTTIAATYSPRTQRVRRLYYPDVSAQKLSLSVTGVREIPSPVDLGRPVERQRDIFIGAAIQTYERLGRALK